MNTIFNLVVVVVAFSCQMHIVPSWTCHPVSGPGNVQGLQGSSALLKDRWYEILELSDCVEYVRAEPFAFTRICLVMKRYYSNVAGIPGRRCHFEILSRVARKVLSLWVRWTHSTVWSNALNLPGHPFRLKYEFSQSPLLPPSMCQRFLTEGFRLSGTPVGKGFHLTYFAAVAELGDRQRGWIWNEIVTVSAPLCEQ